MCCCGQGAAGSATAVQTNSQNPPSPGYYINGTPGIVTSFSRATNGNDAERVARTGDEATADPFRDLLARFGVENCPPGLLLAVLILTFLALRK